MTNLNISRASAQDPRQRPIRPRAAAPLNDKLLHKWRNRDQVVVHLLGGEILTGLISDVERYNITLTVSGRGLIFVSKGAIAYVERVGGNAR